MTVDILFETTAVVDELATSLVLQDGTRIPFEHLAQIPGSIARLVGEGLPASDLEQIRGGAGDIASVIYFLDALTARRALRKVLRVPGHTIAELVPLSHRFRFRGASEISDKTYRLANNAFLARADDGPVVECPTALARVSLLSTEAVRICSLALESRTPADLATLVDTDVSVVRAFLSLLLEGGLAQVEGSDGIDPVASGWPLSDALFHARSRFGRTDRPVFRSEPRDLPPRPVRQPGGIQLPDTRVRLDEPLSQTLQERRSIRRYGRPINIDELACFLDASCRVMNERPVAYRGADGNIHEDAITARPYAAGGAIYAIVPYIFSVNIDGLSEGLYAYDDQGHTLFPVAATQSTGSIVQAARWALLPGTEPQAIILLAACFPEKMAVYDAPAYALLLKDVGGLIATMYLAATAMKLAPCALGDSDSDALSASLGVSFFEETTVGEFLLGTRPSG